MTQPCIESQLSFQISYYKDCVPDIDSDLVSRQPSMTLNSQNHTDMEQNIHAADKDLHMTLDTQEASSLVNTSIDVPLVTQHPFTSDDILASSLSTNTSLAPPPRSRRPPVRFQDFITYV